MAFFKEFEYFCTFLVVSIPLQRCLINQLRLFHNSLLYIYTKALAVETHILKVHSFSTYCVLLENSLMVTVKRKPKCQFSNSNQSSTGKINSLGKRRIKERKSITHKISSENVCWMNSQGSQLEPMLPLHFRKFHLDISGKLVRKTWQKFFCFRG